MEFASATALPLWDFWYLLFDSGSSGPAAAPSAWASLPGSFAARSPLPTPLRVAAAGGQLLSLPPESVGSLASLAACSTQLWLGTGLSEPEWSAWQA
jgi:hypothetical protein